MKVIKAGRKQTGWAKEFTCTGKGNGNGGCGATLLVEAGDLYQTSSSHYDGSTDHYTTFTCGSCGVETDIDCPSHLHPLPTKSAWKSRRGID
jgi:transcription elongation factor Elf1